MFKFSKFAYTIFMLQCVFDISSTNKNVIVPPRKLIEVPLTKINSNYYGYIVVGTSKTKEKNNQIFRVNFDTGSQHLWLISTENCPTPDCKDVKYTPYDQSKSTSYVMSEVSKQFKLEYTDGLKVTGHLGWDYIQLDLRDATVKINQTIGFASEVDGNLKDCDGIFGLGLLSRSLFPGSPDPPMYTLFKKYGIAEFGIYLARVLKGDGAGMLVFGGHDASLIEGNLQFHNVERVKGIYEGYKIKFDKIIVQKGKFRKEIPTENMLALPDSGNNVIVGPKEIFDNINNDIIGLATFEYNRAEFKNMPGTYTMLAAYYYKDFNQAPVATYQENIHKTVNFRCSENLDELPNVIFVMDGREYTLFPKDYIWTLTKGKLCRLGLIGMNTDHVVLGQIFMQTFYTKFNVIDRTVGFARAKHP